MPKLTKRFVESAEIKAKPYFIFDNTLPGFSICISPKGKKHYCFQYKKNKRVKRIWIGLHGSITTEQARTEALTKLSEVKAGKDPHKEKGEQERKPILQDMATRFIDEHISIHCKPKTQKEYKRLLKKRILPALGNFKISEITHSDVAPFHSSLGNIPYTANKCIEILSSLFSFAEKHGLCPRGTNPCTYITKFSEEARCRYLTQEETERLGAALNEVKNYPDENLAAVYCILLLVLTGARLGEIRTLKWEYINYERQEFRLPDSKTGPKTIYAGAAMNILQEIKHHPARPKDNPYVIWGKNSGACLNNIQKPWRRFCRLANLNNVRIHDLRHNFASFAINRGINLDIIGKLLGHTQPQTTSRYAHFMTDTMHNAVNAFAPQLKYLLKIEDYNRIETNTNTASLDTIPLSTSPGDLNLNTDNTSTKETEKTHNITGTSIQAPIYLTSQQAAEYLSVKQSLMEDWRYRKAGPAFIKVGGRVRYKLEELKKFLPS